MNAQPYFRLPFQPESFDNGAGLGVRVSSVEKDDSPPRLVYDPTHPDAIKTGPKAGYVEMPNVNIVTEMVDLIAALARLRGQLDHGQRIEGDVHEGPRDREVVNGAQHRLDQLGL